MDIMELGAIGELVGGVAVIGSLVYVGRQARYTAQRSGAKPRVARTMRDSVLSRLYSSPALCSAWTIRTRLSAPRKSSLKGRASKKGCSRRAFAAARAALSGRSEAA